MRFLLRSRQRLVDVAREQDEILAKQQALIKILQREKEEVILQATRSLRELAIAFRIAVEQPEIDIRDDLDNLISDLDGQMAVIEEHVVSEVPRST